jgi:hypothetical protein
MKIWRSFGSEHSSNIVMIGNFKSETDAQKTEQLFEELHQLANEEHAAGNLKDDWSNTRYSDRMLKFFSEKNIADLGYNDAAIFLYDYRLRRDGQKLVLTTEEGELNAFIKLMLKGGAKIELYSAHDYPGQYGRGR